MMLFFITIFKIIFLFNYYVNVTSKDSIDEEFLINFEVFMYQNDISGVNFTLTVGDDLIKTVRLFLKEYPGILPEEFLSTQNLITSVALDKLSKKFPAFALNFHFYEYHQIQIQSNTSMLEYVGIICHYYQDRGSDYKLCIEQLYSEIWKVISTSIIQSYDSDIFEKRSMEIIQNPNITFVVMIPDGSSTGLGNLLKGLITFLSIHPNTQIENNEAGRYGMGHFDSILEDHLVYRFSHSTRRREQLSNVKYVSTYKLLITKEMENKIDNAFHRNITTTPDLDPYYLDNPQLISAFSTRVSVDGIYNRSLIPTIVVKKFLSVIRNQLHFKPIVLDVFHELSDSLIHPSLGVSVRSWRAAYEDEYLRDISMQGRSLAEITFDIQNYIDIIRTAVERHHIRSIFLSYDSDYVKYSMQPFLRQLEERGIMILEYDGDGGSTKENDFVDSAINMLVLSNTNVLIGDKRSTFMEIAYWFGECRQVVYHPELSV